jgi:hypothetical protein
MLALKRFRDCPPLPQREGIALKDYLWPSERPKDSPQDTDNIRQEFNDHCALCPQKTTTLHHIVPWREALLVYDGDHARRDNLIPLCNDHHKRADAEEYARDFLHGCRMNPTACVANPLSNRSTESEIYKGRGYTKRAGDLQKAARYAQTTEVKAELLARAASARRRKGLGESVKLLDEAEDLKPRNNETRALIFYERGKIASLKSLRRGDFGAAAFLDSKNATSDQLLFRMAQFSHRWAQLRKEAGGTQAPAISLESEFGITQFEIYRDSPARSLLGKRWYVYQLCNIGEYYAEMRMPEESIGCLADASDWIDKLSMTELRPKLYQNLALAFRAREDWWRCVLAASASQGLFYDLGRQENKGQTLLTYLEVLEKLRLQSWPQFPEVEKEGLNLNPEMNNRGAFEQILKLTGARGCIP